MARRTIKASPILYRLVTGARSMGRRFLLGYQHIDGLPGRIHFADLSFQAATPGHYGVAARSAITVISKALEDSNRDADDIHSVLDFACGYGRVLRLLKSRFPAAHIDACDLVPQAVSFCAREFGARGVLAATKGGQTKFPRRYDLIWVGSLFTHLDSENFISTLTMLGTALEPDGVLIITTHGRFSLEILHSYGLEIEREEAEKKLDQEGYFFAPYRQGGEDYGFSICGPSYVQRAVAQAEPNLKLVKHWPRGWDNHQDVYVLRP